MPDAADQLCSLFESRLPLSVDSDGSQDDWNVIGPAILAGAVRHLREIIDLQASSKSRVVGWQLVRSMFEYVATYAWIAAEPTERAKRWLKYDYDQRRKLDDDMRQLGEPLLDDEWREKMLAYGEELHQMPGMVERATGADQAWDERFRELEQRLGDEWPEWMRRFRLMYPLIYRNGSRFTHPSSHVVDAFVTGAPPQLVIGEEKALEQDLAVIGSAILALGLAAAVWATPALGISLDEVVEALAV